MKIVPDTSVLIDGAVSRDAEGGFLDADTEIVIPELAVDELENQANRGLSTGYNGIEEIEKLRELSEEGAVELEFTGRRPTVDEVELADAGRIDAMIRDIAGERDATLYTSDRVQAKVAEAKGIEVEHIEQEEDFSNPLEEYFDESTMSVHLKQGTVPKAKRGEPGEMEYKEIRDDETGPGEMNALIQKTIEAAESSHDGLVEMEDEGATVVQLGRYRIAVSRPPFSEADEITAVRPVADVTLEDYDLSDKLLDRLDEQAEGILIAGAPGHGKSTFAQALAGHYENQGRVMKTMEKPRDLDVGPDITQYTELDEDMENTGDFLLLVRPDYTVYDEVRKTEDFEVFSDMRMAGVGMMGVVHATEPIDAVQRLIGRVELGMIPQVCDTVIGIEDAEVSKVYKLELTVKVPEGMNEADLARPVVLVRDLEDDTAEYEIYTYGEETVVVPLDTVAGGGEASSRRDELAAKQLEYMLGNEVSNPVISWLGDNHVEVLVDDHEVAQVIGNGGENIDRLEQELGLSITVESKEEEDPSSGGHTPSSTERSLDFDMEVDSDTVTLVLGDRHGGEDITIRVGREDLMNATVGRNGTVTLTRGVGKAESLASADESDVEVVK